MERNNWIPYAGDQRGLLVGAPIAGPFVEETLKGLGVLLIFVFFRSLFRSPRDGFIMGALIGAGFNWFESALYVANDYAEWGIHTWGTELGGRWALFGFGSHALFTGLTGLGLGYAAVSRRRIRAVIWGVFGYLLAVIAHLVNNGLSVAVVVILHKTNQPIPDLDAPTPVEPFLTAWTSASIRSLVMFLPSVLFILIVLRRTGKWEQATIRTQLIGESPAIVTDEERAQIQKETGFRTRKYRWEPRASSGKLIAAQNKLAFLKYQVWREGGDPDSDVEVERQRQRIAWLRSQN